jgi:hypothetical protein
MVVKSPIEDDNIINLVNLLIMSIVRISKWRIIPYDSFKLIIPYENYRNRLSVATFFRYFDLRKL